MRLLLLLLYGQTHRQTHTENKKQTGKMSWFDLNQVPPMLSKENRRGWRIKKGNHGLTYSRYFVPLKQIRHLGSGRVCSNTKHHTLPSACFGSIVIRGTTGHPCNMLHLAMCLVSLVTVTHGGSVHTVEKREPVLSRTLGFKALICLFVDSCV